MRDAIDTWYQVRFRRAGGDWCWYWEGYEEAPAQYQTTTAAERHGVGKMRGGPYEYQIVRIEAYIVEEIES